LVRIFSARADINSSSLKELIEGPPALRISACAAWPSAEGTAKIGDFGLAVDVNLSRLTESGMIVGTVAYMPPEQAMGGAVTARTDLYSLGAMLYEIVAGGGLIGKGITGNAAYPARQ
jgi:serine/threonine protein kinase